MHFVMFLVVSGVFDVGAIQQAKCIKITCQSCVVIKCTNKTKFIVVRIHNAVFSKRSYNKAQCHNQTKIVRYIFT